MNDLKAIILKILYNQRRMLIAYSLIGLAFVWMYVAIFPSFSQQGQEFVELLQSYPEQITAVFGIEDLSFASLQNFLALEHFSIIWPLLMILLMLGFSAPSIAGEIEKGTIELILGKPVSRLAVFFGAYFASVTALIIFIFFSIFSAIPLAMLHGIKFEFMNYVSVAYMGLLFGLAVLGVGFLFSALFSERSKVYFATGGILGLMYALTIASNLSENFSSQKYLSFFHYFNGVDTVINNQIDPLSAVVLLTVSVILTIYAAYYFYKRDIAI